MKQVDLIQGHVLSRNLNYWDSVSTLAGEVPVPHKTFPRALFAAVVLVVLTYALPLMVGLGVTRVVKDWKLGYFSYIAQQVVSDLQHQHWPHRLAEQLDNFAAPFLRSPSQAALESSACHTFDQPLHLCAAPGAPLYASQQLVGSLWLC